MEHLLVVSQVSAKTNAVIRNELSGTMPDPAAGMPTSGPPVAPSNPAPAQAQPDLDPSQTLDTMTALILGSPEFQMH
jgi:hypothetical protein